MYLKLKQSHMDMVIFIYYYIKKALSKNGYQMVKNIWSYSKILML